MPRAHLTIVFKLDTFNVILALEHIQQVFVERGLPLDGEVDGRSLKLPKVTEWLRKRGSTTFNLVGEAYEFDLGVVRNFNLDFLEIQSVAEPTVSWDAWASPFISDPNFIMAWVADSEYEHWQNAYHPLQYTAVGKSYAHLPMRSNGLPYPLEEQIIDTSANPGRRCLRNGYIEVVGGLMWLGELFWALTGASKDRVDRAFPWLQTSHPTPSVVRIHADEGYFRSAEGISARHQVDLRAVLFPSTVPVSP